MYIHILIYLYIHMHIDINNIHYILLGCLLLLLLLDFRRGSPPSAGNLQPAWFPQGTSASPDFKHPNSQPAWFPAATSARS